MADYFLNLLINIFLMAFAIFSVTDLDTFDFNFKENKYLTGVGMEYDKLKKILNIK
ncbi:MAG: hypothetical protein ABSB78_02120 [Bacteroidota bacterium]